MRGNVDPFIVMDVMENARKAEEGGRKIIHMEVGQPSTAAPSASVKAPTPKITTALLPLPTFKPRVVSFLKAERSDPR